MSGEFDAEIDYYEVLQVHPKAETAVIRSAYRAIVKDLHAHPDLGGSHEQAVLINEAYRVLSDTQLREAYDRARREQAPPAKPARPEAPPSSPSPAATWEAICSSCGRVNQLRAAMIDPRARCGSCHGRLFPVEREAAAPIKVKGLREENRLLLAPEIYTELKARGEVELRTDKVPRGGKITCRRCRKVWTAVSAGPVPRHCPACGVVDWSALRAFKCRYCGHEFTTFSLRRRPYLLFPGCPRCGKAGWHNGLESGPLSNLLRFLKK